MKKILKVIVLVLFATIANAQLVVDSSKNFKAEVYAGILTGPHMTVKDSTKISAFVTVRAGGNIYWTPQPWFSLTGIAAAEINEKASVTVLYLVGARFKLHKHVFITVGKIGTPMTELRPFPNTMGGQFEPWTKRQILGSAFGGKATFKINEKSSIVAGGFLRDKDGSIELGAKTRFVQLGGYYLVKARTFGAAATLSTKYVSQTLVYNHQRNFGSLTNITIPKTAGLGLFSDVGFGINGKHWDWIRGEWGVMKVFTIAKKVNALIAVSYAHKNPGSPSEVWAYLQISL